MVLSILVQRLLVCDIGSCPVKGLDLLQLLPSFLSVVVDFVRSVHSMLTANVHVFYL